MKRFIASICVFLCITVACMSDDADITENHPNYIVGEVSKDVPLGMSSGKPTWKVILPTDINEFEKEKIIVSLSDWSLSTNYLQWKIEYKDVPIEQSHDILTECKDENAWNIFVYSVQQSKMPLLEGDSTNRAAGYAWWFVAQNGNRCSLVYFMEELGIAQVDDLNRVVRHEFGHAFGLVHNNDGKSVMSAYPISTAEWIQSTDKKQYCDYWKCP